MKPHAFSILSTVFTDLAICLKKIKIIRKREVYKTSALKCPWLDVGNSFFSNSFLKCNVGYSGKLELSKVLSFVKSN